MRFERTVIRNFRNLTSKSPELNVKWSPGINLILGPNGSGKTNLLEALSILSGWGAFGRTSNVISWDSERRNAFIGAEIGGETQHTLTANISSRVSLRCDDKAITSTDVRLVLPSVLFLTGNVNLIDSSPSARRMFIDRLCALFYPPYARKLADFKYILRTRTVLMRQGRSPERTDIPYCETGGLIMQRRREVVAQLAGMLPADKFRLSVTPEVKGACDEYLSYMLKRNYTRELHALRPQDGPSYDDLTITLANGRTAGEALSRGQKRRLILFMLITAGKLTALRMKKEPVMLFDDLTAELDAEGREFVNVELAKTGWQTFITAPENPFRQTDHYNQLNMQ